MADMTRGRRGHTTTETTGHDWDGIKELNNPLPRWWLWTFYATIVWAVGYMICYPAWPLINGATPGLLGYSTRAERRRRNAVRSRAGNAPLNTRSPIDADSTPIARRPGTLASPIAGGGAVFRNLCPSATAPARRRPGYPNLLDDDWLWGGTIEDIHHTAPPRHPQRRTTTPAFGQMPAFDEILEDDEILGLVEYVRSLSGLEHDEAAAAAQAEAFVDNAPPATGKTARASAIRARRT